MKEESAMKKEDRPKKNPNRQVSRGRWIPLRHRGSHNVGTKKKSLQEERDAQKHIGRIVLRK